MFWVNNNIFEMVCILFHINTWYGLSFAKSLFWKGWVTTHFRIHWWQLEGYLGTLTIFKTGRFYWHDMVIFVLVSISTITKYHSLSDLNNRNLFSHSPGGQLSETSMSAQSISSGPLSMACRWHPISLDFTWCCPLRLCLITLHIRRPIITP